MLKKKIGGKSYVEPFVVIYWTAISLSLAPHWDDVSSICQLCSQGSCSLHVFMPNYIWHLIQYPEEHNGKKNYTNHRGGGISRKLHLRERIHQHAPEFCCLQSSLISNFSCTRELWVQRREMLQMWMDLGVGGTPAIARVLKAQDKRSKAWIWIPNRCRRIALSVVILNGNVNMPTINGSHLELKWRSGARDKEMVSVIHLETKKVHSYLIQ